MTITDTTITDTWAFEAHPDTPAERRARGRGVRKRLARSSHAGWQAPADRPDPVELLVRQERTRIPELVPLRHQRMLASPFAFFRGAALLMASDLAGLPRSDLQVQLCGDAHLSNFGIFAAPDRRLVFSLNDFDETLPGPFEWDVKRLAASFAVAGRARGFGHKKRVKVARRAARAYREAMADFASERNLDVWYARMDVDEVLARHRDEVGKKQLKRTNKVLRKARSKDSLKAAAKLTHSVDGRLQFISDPPLIVPIEQLVPEVDAREISGRVGSVFEAYRDSLRDDRRQLLERFHYVHLARKVVGVGSVGTRAWVVLLQGRDGDDPLLLQFKEAEASVLEEFLGPSEYDNHGQRVVNGLRLLQSASDELIGWTRSSGIDGVERDYYGRQLWDHKGSSDVDRMNPSAMAIYAQLCGWALARSHARSGDAAEIAGYLGSGTHFDDAMSDFADDYVDQNDRDHAALQAAVDTGRVAASAAT